MECEPPPRGSEGKPPPKGEGGGEPPLKEEEGWELEEATTTQGGGGRRRSEPPSHGEVEGIHFNVLSFRSKKENGRATQRKQRKAAPPKGGGGRQHHQKEEVGEKFSFPFWWCCPPSPPWGGCPGHGPVHALVTSARCIGFSWDSLMTRWYRPGLPGLSNLAGLDQHFRSAIIDAWRNKVTVDSCARRGSRGGPLLDLPGSQQLLNSSHVRERDKALLRSIVVGGVWNGFLLGKVRGEAVPCRFCGGGDGDGHLFWECPYPPLVEIRENPEFQDLMRMDKSHCPGAYSGMVGFLFFLELLVSHLGLLKLMMLPSICLRVL